MHPVSVNRVRRDRLGRRWRGWWAGSSRHYQGWTQKGTRRRTLRAWSKAEDRGSRMLRLFKRPDGESRVYWWWSPEAVGGVKRLWRHGRFHLHASGMGRRNKHIDTRTGERSAHYGKRGELTFGAEWLWFPPKSSRFGVGFAFKWGTNGSETTPDISIYLGVLGSVWFHFGHIIPYRWLERHKPDGTVDYDTRVFSLNASGTCIRWEFWNREHHWARSDPWWMSGRIGYRDLFFGRDDCTTEITDEGTTVVPMPEKSYPATYKIERRTWRHRRPLGRLRDKILGARTRLSTTITPGEPIPVPGKGENSWDCDDDHIHSSSSGGAAVETAVAGIIESALRARARYGGAHMSVPS